MPTGNIPEAPELWTSHDKGQNVGSQWCPLYRGFTVPIYYIYMVRYCVVYIVECLKAVTVLFTGVVTPLPSSAELQTFGVVIVGPVFSDDSTEPAPTPLKVAAMFRQGDRAVQPVPLKLPTVKLPHW